MTGLCDCPAGWGGSDCAAPDKRPCTNRYNEAERAGQGRASHIGPDKRDADWMVPGWTASRCAGVCDDDIGACFCDGPKFGRVPAPPGSPPGTPPIRAGRFLQEHCKPKECSGHGDCNLGFCKCHAGWFGHDCAGRVEGEEAESQEEVPRGVVGKPWLGDVVRRPPASLKQAAEVTRRRPFIYVYDTPAPYAARMAESLFHELLLQSPHRTLDPEEADFFYVPAYTSCYMWPVHAWADYPFWHSHGGPRVRHASAMTLELLRHIQSAYPYWNRTGGRDHVWLFSHDEGACWAPTEVYTTSIILTHWGRLDLDHRSNTAFVADNYTQERRDPASPLTKDGWTHLITGHPCYTPGKDLVIPAVKAPGQLEFSPLMGAPLLERTTLLYFRRVFGCSAGRRGDVGKNRLKHYSRGIRQRLYKLALRHGWAEKYAIRIGDRADVPGDYSRHLATAKYCLVSPGDGFSARAEDAVLHGCVPVIVMDNVHTLFETLMDWDSFSVRVAEGMLHAIPEILLSIPEVRG
ncbi:exostosin-like glycosyltransferase [Monoraphidium neglectum]|uniref:Exostosin-like glycosyltransferase n=1 Tax=Monoraphidium neglectum TaxID=145388 RepID=A0A0D2N0X6_9CHLO|nr:exostosin-like glycosyltransferase [Monoraphidium neglectum]KIZ06152.1 exostosin-like glycosyltransferase [Monoraphidium neglectum]|eukprot:XP_013905171.1 exostosin-like glycosyltransferase [Monoraphidium neglectum]